MEILGLTQKLVERAFPQTPAPAPPTQAQPFQVDPEGYVMGRDLVAAQQDALNRFTPDVTAAVDLAANANYSFARSQYAKEFSKWGPEIAQRLSGVPKKLWTMETLDTVVKLVRADHLDELRTEWTTEIRASMEPTIRSGGAGGSVPVSEKDKSNSLESEKIPDEWKARAAKAGLTESTIREFCFKNDMTEAQFFKQFETPLNPIVAEVQSGR